jgi:DNA-binding response OmpR family regulator
VDDDADFLAQMKRWFVATCLGYEVVLFSSSVDAVDYIRLRNVDLVLTAYLVPQIDGLRFISIVRSFNAEVPIIMLSNVPVQAAALARGATAFLSKGALWTHLETRVRELRDAAYDQGGVETQGEKDVAENFRHGELDAGFQMVAREQPADDQKPDEDVSDYDGPEPEQHRADRKHGELRVAELDERIVQPLQRFDQSKGKRR